MPAVLKWILAALAAGAVLTQCRRPWGWLGRRVARAMNVAHAGLASWGLDGIEVSPVATVLDIGCGGGETVNRLAALASEGKVHGIDYSRASVAVARARNRPLIESGRVEIHEGTVSSLPFADGMFDLVTAVETHYYWPDLLSDLREARRVLKPGGRIVIVAECYRGGRATLLYRPMMAVLGGRYLTADVHRDALTGAGYADVEIRVEPGKGWIRAAGSA